MLPPHYSRKIRVDSQLVGILFTQWFCTGCSENIPLQWCAPTELEFQQKFPLVEVVKDWPNFKWPFHKYLQAVPDKRLTKACTQCCSANQKTHTTEKYLSNSTSAKKPQLLGGNTPRLLGDHTSQETLVSKCSNSYTTFILIANMTEDDRCMHNYWNANNVFGKCSQQGPWQLLYWWRSHW